MKGRGKRPGSWRPPRHNEMPSLAASTRSSKMPRRTSARHDWPSLPALEKSPRPHNAQRLSASSTLYFSPISALTNGCRRSPSCDRRRTVKAKAQATRSRFMRSCSCAPTMGTVKLYGVDLRRRALQNLPDLPDLLRRPRCLRRVHRATNVLHSAVNFHHRLAEDALRELRDLGKDVVDQRLVLRQMLSALFRDLVDLLAAFFGQCASVAEVLEHRQRRINSARAGRVHAAETLLDFLDDLVA